MTIYTQTPDFYNDYIAHHGVKGMRWGIRKKTFFKGLDNKRKARRKIKEEKKREKEKELKPYINIDPEFAKNKQTKRAAYDYHNMSDLMFSAKYKTSKKKFKKRYIKTKGDTYSLGKKKQAVALAVLALTPTKNVYVGNGKTIKTGRGAIPKSLAYDYGSVAIGTNFRYKKAEEKYNKKKRN